MNLKDRNANEYIIIAEKTVYHLITVVDSCCITGSHVFLLFFCISLLAQNPSLNNTNGVSNLETTYFRMHTAGHLK